MKEITTFMKLSCKSSTYKSLQCFRYPDGIINAMLSVTAVHMQICLDNGVTSSEALIKLYCVNCLEILEKFSVLQENPCNIDHINSLSANPTKWSNTLKQFLGNSRRIF